MGIEHPKVLKRSSVTQSPKGSNLEFDLEILKKKLARGEEHSLTVVSDSMEPLIKTGEEVIVCSLPDPQNLKIFDIILFHQGNRLNAHFLTKVDWKSDHYVTRPLKGSSRQDYPLTYKNIIGLIAYKKLSWWQKLRIVLLS